MEQVKTAYFVYVYKQQGNVGVHHLELLNDQEDGFNTYESAERWLLDKIRMKKGYHFDRAWYKFVILKSYNSLSAV